MGRIILRGASPAPATYALSGWWRASYTADPWISVPSSTSGIRLIGSGGSAPGLSAVTQNGFFPASFDGTSQYLYAGVDADIFDVLSASAYTVILVTRPWTPSAPSANIQDNQQLVGDTYRRMGLSWTPDGVALWHYDGAYKQTVPINTAPDFYHFIVATFNGTTLSLTVDNKATVTAAAGNLVTLESSLYGFGVSWNGASKYTKQDVLEIITAKSVLSNGEIADIKAYAEARYNLTFPPRPGELFDEASIVDSVVTAGSYVRSNDDTASVTDTVGVGFEIARVVNDTVAVTDEFAGTVSLSALPLAIWLDNYGGSPWTGIASAGTSGSNNATEGTNPPSTGTSQNGKASADFDGTNDYLLMDDNADTYMSADPDGSFSGVILFEADAAFTADIANPYNEPALLGDNSGSVGAVYSTAGFGIYLNTNVEGWKSVHAPAATSTKHFGVFRFNASANELAVGINGPPTHSIYAAPRDNDLEFRTLRIGRSFDGTNYFNGRIWTIVERKGVFNDAELADIVAQLNARFNLALTQTTNRQTGTYTGCASADGHTFSGAQVTAAAAFAQRDGAILQYIPSTNKYWLFGGWRSSGYGPWGGAQTTNEVWSSSDLSSWTSELSHDANPPTSGAGARPKPRHCAGTAWDGTYWYIIGSDQYDSARADVWRTSDGTTWERRCELAPWGKKLGLICGYYDSALHVIGGCTYEASVLGYATRQHYKSTDGGQTWQQLPDIPVPRSFVGKLLSHCGYMFLIGGNSGGLQGGTRVYCNDTWAWDGTYWRQQSSSAPWAGRMWFDVEVYDNRLWALPGRDSDSTDTSDAWYSLDAGKTWTQVTAPWAGFGTHADGVTALGPDGIAMASGFGIDQRTFYLKSAGSFDLSASDSASVADTASFSMVYAATATTDSVSVTDSVTAETSQAFSPTTLELSGFWRNFDGGAWEGTASVGTSGSNDLLDPGNEPSVGATLNGHATASFDGVNDFFEFEGTAATYGASTMICGWVLVKITDTSSSALLIDCTSMGFQLSVSGGDVFFSAGFMTASHAISSNTWTLVTFRYDGTKVQIGVNEAPGVDGGSTSVNYTDPLDLTGTLRFGSQGGTSSFVNGLVAEIGLAKVNLNNANYTDLKSYINSYYALSI